MEVGEIEQAARLESLYLFTSVSKNCTDFRQFYLYWFLPIRWSLGITYNGIFICICIRIWVPRLRVWLDSQNGATFSLPPLLHWSNLHLARTLKCFISRRPIRMLGSLCFLITLIKMNSSSYVNFPCPTNPHMWIKEQVLKMDLWGPHLEDVNKLVRLFKA